MYSKTMNIQFPSIDSFLRSGDIVLDKIATYLNTDKIRPTREAKVINSGISALFGADPVQVQISVDVVYENAKPAIRFMINQMGDSHLTLDRAAEFHQLYGKMLQLAYLASEAGKTCVEK
jgi:hypothetical protein